MIPEGSEQTAQVLENLAKELGTTVTHLWAVLSISVWAVVLECVAFMVTMGLIGLIVNRIGIWMANTDRGCPDAWNSLKGLGIVLMIAVIIPFVIGLYWTAIGLINPEIYALKRLLSIL
jgi:sorbitol-specific phosphotransferase system component IIBC